MFRLQAFDDPLDRSDGLEPKDAPFGFESGIVIWFASCHELKNGGVPCFGDSVLFIIVLTLALRCLILNLPVLSSYQHTKHHHRLECKPTQWLRSYMSFSSNSRTVRRPSNVKT